MEIIEKMNLKGVRVNKTNFRWILSNPFYVGYVTGRLVNGKLIQGRQPAIIDLKTFMLANNLLQTAVNVAIPKQHKIDQLPLKVFVKDEDTNSPFTGYSQKGHWYYKARGIGASVNINATKLNAIFCEKLKGFELGKSTMKN